MNNEALHMIYTSVIRAKLLYAASAWWGLQQLLTVSASRHLSNEASALDCVHGADVSSLAELVDSADDALGLYQGIFGRPIGQAYAIGNPSVCLSVCL